MANHQQALVPIEAWAYHSPDVRNSGRMADVGLFAESLVYYDRVLVLPATEIGFASFIRWFADRGCLDDLLALMQDGTVGIYHYAFFTLPFEKDGVWTLSNWQDEESKSTAVFERRIIDHPELARVLKVADRDRLKKALDGRTHEVKSTGFGPAIDHAMADSANPARVALAVQAYADAIAAMRGERPPEVSATVEGNAGRQRIRWNVNFEALSKGLLPDAQLREHIPLTALGHANRLIWSAAEIGSDAFLTSPMSVLVGDKLYEGASRAGHLGTIIDTLQAEVEFPDVRRLVNAGKLTFKDVLLLRRKAKRFRIWLQDEAERDRNALIAYHNETAKEVGWVRGGRKLIRLFGTGLGAAGGALVGNSGGPLGAVTGAAAGAVVGDSVTYLFDVASRMNADWRPVVFGQWAKDRIEKLTSAK